MEEQISLKRLNRSTVDAKTYPQRIVQFGEGNFLRAFANWMVHEMNNQADFNSGVAVIQPIDRGLIQMLKDQDGLYTLYLNGIKNGQAVSEHQVIECIQSAIDPYKDFNSYLQLAEVPELRFMISNTTEAGIAYNGDDRLQDNPPKSFPAKLTILLFKRFQAFEGAKDKGLILIPCELINNNGEQLKSIVLQYASNWNLGDDFKQWINEANTFCNTLVDRIVPGYPKSKMPVITEELGYQDNLVVEGEQFHLWVIEGPDWIENEIPAKAANLNIVFTNNMQPYRTRKVRILNGAHTTLVPVGYLYGIDTVRESIEDSVVGAFLKEAIFEEICPTLDLPDDELKSFADDVIDRFKNPYLEHALMSISLNSISKYKTRVLPSLLEFVKRKGTLPKRLVFSLAALIIFYRGDRDGDDINLNDSQDILDFFKSQWKRVDSGKSDMSTLAKETLSNTDFWDLDLTSVDGLEVQLTDYISRITAEGIKIAIHKI